EAGPVRATAAATRAAASAVRVRAYKVWSPCALVRGTGGQRPRRVNTAATGLVAWATPPPPRGVNTTAWP
ncbi:hypothetical protein, partial [Streptomyces caniscabiei]|uniref:hypothetical protein n=1 Tax=Streptomyces caniscabiei TaxID=2746961 RepID=UPI001F356D4C